MAESRSSYSAPVTRIEIIDGDETKRNVIHEPLDSRKRTTRVLVVRPGSGDDVLQATLEISSVPRRTILTNVKSEESKDQMPLASHQNSPTQSGEPGSLDEIDWPDCQNSVLVKTKGSRWVKTSPQDDVAAMEPPVLNYEAISYCWGHANGKSEILLNGVRCMAPSGAVRVVRRFRQIDEYRSFWIDALCIDQENIQERQLQVEMMADIYTNSGGTLVFLGSDKDEDKSLEQAVMLCTEFGKLVADRAEVESEEFLEWLESTGRKYITNSDDFRVLRTIFERPWFKRTWVWQEAMLCTDCMCYVGPYSIPLRCISGVAFYCLTLRNNSSFPERIVSDIFLTNVETLADMFGYNTMIGNVLEHAWPLSQLVKCTRQCNSTEPRDKIFGLLGMTSWSRSGEPFPDGLRVDYRKSLRNCMRDATRVMIEEDRNLLALHQKSEWLYAEWPSWTICWSEKSIPSGPPMHISRLCAHGGIELALRDPAEFGDDDSLVLDGIHVDIVAAAFPISPSSFGSVEKA